MPRQVEQRIGKRVRSWTRRPGRQSVFLMPRIETAFSKSLQIIAMKFQEICNDCSRLGPSARAGEECHCLQEIHRPHRPAPDVVEGLKHNRGPQPTISCPRADPFRHGTLRNFLRRTITQDSLSCIDLNQMLRAQNGLSGLGGLRRPPGRGAVVGRWAGGNHKGRAGDRLAEFAFSL
jgi:hypothetical protein